MLLKTGVDISRLNPAIRKYLNTIANIVFSQAKQELVITSTYEGTHSPSSLHYANLAIDIRIMQNKEKVLAELKKALGSKYTILDEVNHIHIQYDQT